MTFKEKFDQFVDKHGKKFLIYTTIFLIFGIACLVIGFGLADGWDTILAWFGTKYAWYCYIAGFIYIVIVATIAHYHKVKKEEDKILCTTRKSRT